jgi:hypothetical protein
MISTKTIDLPSGAKLTVTIDANLFELKPADREVVWGIVDEARRFLNATEVKVSDHIVATAPAQTEQVATQASGPEAFDLNAELQRSRLHPIEFGDQ